VTHPTVVSGWSATLSVSITAATETVSTPTTPSGATSGTTGSSYSYTTGGSSSNLGHTVEYQFDWSGAGTDLSSWGASTQAKSWSAAGTYGVRARSRCVTHPTVVSGWSPGLSVSVAVAGYLNVTFIDAFLASGRIGGFFVPASKSYTLQNTGIDTIQCTADNTQNWLNPAIT
jgi:hypothetical protein